MEILLKASDVFQFAIRIEEDGEIFYHRAALMAEDTGTKNLFNQLADEEVRHKKVFQDMLSKIGEHIPTESFQGEYIAYLRDYIDNKAVFTSDIKNHQSMEVHDALSAIMFAMQRELDSVAYYQEIKRSVPEKQHGAIDGIIEEERRHFTKLAELKKTYR